MYLFSCVLFALKSIPFLFRQTEITIVLIGTIGSGKSRTGNTIIGHNCFQHTFSSERVTENSSKMGCSEVDIHDTEHYQLHLTVIDTPGLQKFEEIGKFQKEIKLDGISVYLFVIAIGRFRSDDKILLEGLLKSNTDIRCSTGIVFTRSGELYGETFLQWISDVPTLLRVIDDHQVPYVVIENEDNNGKPRECLIRLIKELHSRKTQHNAKKVITVPYYEMKDFFGNSGVQFFNRMSEKNIREGNKGVAAVRIPFFH